MNFASPIGIVELGNLNIKCIIFQVDKNGKEEILSSSITNSTGIHNGAIVNLDKASKTIRACIAEAEKKIQITIKKIIVITEQTEFLCTKFSKSRKISGSKILKEDIEFLLKEAKKQVSMNDDRHSIIHIFNHNYIVDGKIFKEEPINVYADRLSHEMTFITMPKNNVKNIKQAFLDCDIEVEKVVSSTFALAVKLLNSNEFHFGSTLINIGFEKTSFGLFKNLALVHSATFPIGVNHVVKDISNVCSLSLNESNNIKNDIDFSFNDTTKLFDENDFLKKIYFFDSNFRKISKTLLLKVVNARLEEIFKIIKKQIMETGFISTCGKNIIVTGGGSNLRNLDKYCSNFFEVTVKTISKSNNTKNVEEELEQVFAACLGALKITTEGWETEAIPKKIDEHSKKIGFFAKIFGKKLIN